MGSLLGTLLTPATDMHTLKSFYTSVRPWGDWSFVYRSIKKEGKTVHKNTDFFRDMGNCIVGIIWQSSMILMPIYLVIREYMLFFTTAIVFAVTSTI